MSAAWPYAAGIAALAWVIWCIDGWFTRARAAYDRRTDIAIRQMRMGEAIESGLLASRSQERQP